MIHKRLFLLVLLLAAQACELHPEPGIAKGEELFEACSPCHGEAGVGNPDIEAPAIAGLPQWYLEEQLNAFQRRWRGMHHADLAGLRMRPMAETLNKEGDIVSVAEYVALLPPVQPPSTLGGDAGAGAERYATVCATCHGEDGGGDEILHAPPLVNIDDWYLAGELRDYRDGARGADPDDVWGAQMRAQSIALSDQAIRDVVAYIQTLR